MLQFRFIVFIFVAVACFHVSLSIRFCYVEYDERRPDLIEALDPFLCTHITLVGLGPNIGSVELPNRTSKKEITISWKVANSTLWMSKLLKLKSENPALLVFGTVGCKTQECISFLRPVDIAYYDRYAEALADFATWHYLDGIDFDHEFPSTVASEYGVFTQRVRRAFDENFTVRKKKRLLLTMAVSAAMPIMTSSYNRSALRETVDYVNIMGYDMMAYESGVLPTGHHSALYTSVPFKYIPLINTLNIESVVNWWYNNGLGIPFERMTIGLPAYSHCYRLLNPTLENGTGAPTLGACAEMFMADLCELVSDPPGRHARLHTDVEAKAQYLTFDGNRWATFDWEVALRAKCQYIKATRLAGVMVWYLNSDYDRGQICKNLRFHASDQSRYPFPVHAFMRQCLRGVA